MYTTEDGKVYQVQNKMHLAAHKHTNAHKAV
jgi:hypothetical protein